VPANQSFEKAKVTKLRSADMMQLTLRRQLGEQVDGLREEVEEGTHRENHSALRPKNSVNNSKMSLQRR
jgi:hypothetical protein